MRFHVNVGRGIVIELTTTTVETHAWLSEQEELLKEWKARLGELATVLRATMESAGQTSS